MSNNSLPDAFSCPLPILNYDTIQLAHGAGGKLSSELIEQIFLPCFENNFLDKLEDQATLPKQKERLAFSTDSFVVSPIFFPGGNIGELAINGTVNDISMGGARPLYISAAFIIEEGFAIDELHKIAVSMRNAADKAGIKIVTGDTKVVHKGSCDKIFINTTGIGVIPEYLNLGVDQIKPGDHILLSGTMADHGMAVMSTREGLSFTSRIKSDTAPLNGLVESITPAKHAGIIKTMRDPTRGGVATSLNEFAHSSGLGMRIYEDQLPVKEDVLGACEILGIDPLYVANEGKLIAIVKPEYSDQILDKMRSHILGKNAVMIGEVTAENQGFVVLKNALGIERIIDLPLGEQLPRIC
jgi:hydrogenase expression/formation protein HypE